MDGKKLNLIQLNLAVLMWGGTAMFAKGIKLPTNYIICIRSLIAAFALFVIMKILKIPVLMKEKRDYGIMLTLGILMCLHWLTYFEGLKVSTAVVAILSLHIYPVFIALVEPFVFKEKLRMVDVFLAVLVFIGLVIMTPEFTLENNMTKGIILGVISAVFFTARNLMTRKYVQSYSSYSLMFWQAVVIGLSILPFIIFKEVNGVQEDFNSNTIMLLFLLGVIFTAIPHTLFSASFKNLSAKTVGIFAMLLPFYAAFLGYFFHNETITNRTLIGGSIIFLCVIFEASQNIKKK